MTYEIVVGWYKRFDLQKVIEIKVLVDYDGEYDPIVLKNIVASKMGYYYIGQVRADNMQVPTDLVIDYRYFDVSTK